MRRQHRRLQHAQATLTGPKKPDLQQPARNEIGCAEHECQKPELFKVAYPEARGQRERLSRGLAREDLALEGDDFPLDLVNRFAHDDGVSSGKAYDGLAVMLDRFNQVAVQQERLSVGPR